MCVWGGVIYLGALRVGLLPMGGVCMQKKKMMLAGHKVISQVYYSISFDIS